MEATTIARLFGKCFEIVSDDQWRLPDRKDWFAEGAWKVEALENLKNDLNAVKSRLNDYNLAEWGSHTRRRNKAGQVLWKLRSEIQPELCTQAWAKFYENACAFPLIPETSLTNGELRSVHLCEAPGAFVAALNHWLRLNAPDVRWKWLATTLNPHYEGNSLHWMISDDRLISRTPDNWYFGLDDTGDLMDLRNLDAIVDRAGGKATLVTADGSVSCLDSPAEQERVVSQLLHCEVVAALHLLEKGGNFLLKVFTIFEHQTICLMYLLNCCFDQVFVNKPVTSKEGNSEVYVVCLGFAGADSIAAHVEILRQNYDAGREERAMFRRRDVPEGFVEQIVACSAFFKEHQCEVILSNMRTYGSKIDADLWNTKRIVAERFVAQCELRPLPSEDAKLVGKAKSREIGRAADSRDPVESYNSRQREKQEREKLEPKDRLAAIVVNLRSIAKPETSVNAFNSSDIPDELSISAGKPYAKIRSSRFCTSAVLKTHISVVDIMDDVGFRSAIPSEEAIAKFARENAADDRRVVNFGYANVNHSHGLIVKVCEAFDDLQENQTLTLIGYSLLSRLNVGILCILVGTFGALELQPSEELGCVIDLKNFRKVEKIVGFMGDIFRASVEAERTGQAVLSVLPMSTLCDSVLYRHIVNINHWVIRTNAHCALANIEG